MLRTQEKCIQYNSRLQEPVLAEKPALQMQTKLFAESHFVLIAVQSLSEVHGWPKVTAEKIKHKICQK